MIPDNYDLFEMYEREQERRRERLPKCDKCGEPIDSEKAYNVGDLWCESCFNEWVEEITVWVEEE